MTTSGWVRDLIDDQWAVGASPPPQPEVIVEGDASRRSVHQRDADVIFAKDGGLPTVDPQSIGYREEYVESTVDIEIRTTDGRKRLLGKPDETYGGLEGEVRRIIHKYRIGYPSSGSLSDPGYDVLRIDTFDDEIGVTGAGIWAGTWTITFITYAAQIGQSASNRA